ncbi:MAG: N-acetylmuramoyl-L-alanine amidase [Endomicrobiia bacterium]
MKALTFIFFLFSYFSFLFSIEKCQVIKDDRIKNYIRVEKVKGITYVSLKDIANAFSGRLSWYSVSGKVIFSLNNHKICFFFGSKDVIIDTKKFTLSNETKIISKELYVPLDFFLTEKFNNISEYKIQFNSDKNVFFFDRIVNVFSPRFYSENGNIILSIELADKIPYDIQKVSERNYVITFFRGKAIPEKIEFENGYIKKVEIIQDKRLTKCKISLDSDELELEDFLKENPLRLILKIYSKRELCKIPVVLTGLKEVSGLTTLETETTTVKEIVPSTEIVTSRQIIPSVKPSESRKPVVVIDPGHGGEDPGAIGPNGTKEKDINLAISKKLASLLEEKGYTVYLTRDSDIFVPLVDRTNFANEKNADIFISIHCNASIKKDTKGFEIYFLSENATDASAIATAALENSVIKLEGPPTKKREKLQKLLWSMVVNEYINESSELCGFITQDITKRIKEIENRGIKQAGFYVLRGAQMPAILVECGFITHKEEEVKLRSKRFQEKIVDSIYSGITQYFNKRKI